VMSTRSESDGLPTTAPRAATAQGSVDGDTVSLGTPEDALGWMIGRGRAM
jgi:hypothetical protein